MVGSFRALLTSTYGQVLVCKLILFAAMIGFGAWNLFLLKPRIAIDIPTVNIPEQKSAVRLLLRNVLWEIGLGTLVILIVGLLGITPRLRCADPADLGTRESVWPIRSRHESRDWRCCDRNGTW
jgi:putative copper export protein